MVIDLDIGLHADLRSGNRCGGSNPESGTDNRNIPKAHSGNPDAKRLINAIIPRLIEGTGYVRNTYEYCVVVPGMTPASGALDALLNVLENALMHRMPDGLGPQIKVRRWENVQRVVACPDDGRGAIRVWTQAHFT